MTGSEHRKAPRIQGALPMVTESGKKGITHDLSASGVFFETDGSFAPGQSIEFSIFFEHLYPDRPVCLNCKGVIIRVEKKGDRIGVAASIDSYHILDSLP